MTEDNNEIALENQSKNVEIQNSNGIKHQNGDHKIDLVEENKELIEQPVKEVKSIFISGFGGLKIVKVLKKPEPPKPGDGEVLIRVHSAGLNHNDLLCKQGNLSGLPKLPFILGFECAGVVEEIGQNVDLKKGDRVAVLSDTKAWSELILINAKYVYKLPDNIDFDHAVALTLNYVLAYYLLFEVGNLRPNQSVFVHCVTGEVGQAIVELASTVKDVTIIGTIPKHKQEKIEKVSYLFDQTEDYVAEVKKILPDGVNLVLDCFYGNELNKGYSLLKPLGQYILYGASNANFGLIGVAKYWWQVEKIKPLKLYEENKTISGFNLRQFLYNQKAYEQVREKVYKIFKLYSDGIIKPLIDSKFAFEDISDAFLKLQEGKNLGKIILDPTLSPKPKCVDEENICRKSRFGSRNSKKDAKKDDKKEDDNKEDDVKVEDKKEDNKIEDKIEEKKTDVDGEVNDNEHK